MMNAVIFDMDGVMIDSEPLHVEAEEQMLKRLNIDAGEGYLEKFVGVTAPVMWKQILAEHGVEHDVQDLLNAQLSIKLKLLKKSDYTAIDGIPELLKELYRKRIPVAIASSSASIFIKEVVRKLRVFRYIRDWVSGENLERSKPEPDIFLKAAEILGVESAGCIVIEDSKNGVIAAKRAGMKCVGFRNPNSGNQDVSAADLVVDSIRELTLEALRKL
jgi:HAD superfamily hydrolase (TIGR01509 family)